MAEESDCQCEVCMQCALQRSYGELIESQSKRHCGISVLPSSSELESLLSNLPNIKLLFTEATQVNFEALKVIVKAVDEAWMQGKDSIMVWFKSKPGVFEACVSTFGVLGQRLPSIVRCEEVGDSYNIYLSNAISPEDWKYLFEQFFQYWIAQNQLRNQKDFLLSVLQ